MSLQVISSFLSVLCRSNETVHYSAEAGDRSEVGGESLR